MAIGFEVKAITNDQECEEMLDYVESLDPNNLTAASTVEQAAESVAIECVRLLATGYINRYLLAGPDRAEFLDQLAVNPTAKIYADLAEDAVANHGKGLAKKNKAKAKRSKKNQRTPA